MTKPQNVLFNGASKELAIIRQHLSRARNVVAEFASARDRIAILEEWETAALEAIRQITEPDLSQVPRDRLEAELRRRKRPVGKPPKLAPCPRCEKLINASQKRWACPNHKKPNTGAA